MALFAHTTIITIKHKSIAIQRVVLNQEINIILGRDEFPQLCWIIATPLGLQGRKAAVFSTRWNRYNVGRCFVVM